MDNTSIVGLVLSCSILTLIAVVGIVAPQFFWELSSWRYKNPRAMEPTEGQYRVTRARSAASLSLSVPPLIALAVPGDFQLKLTVWMLTAAASVVVIIAVLVLVSTMRRKTAQATIDHDRPSELSGSGYDVEWFGVAYAFFYTLLIVGIVAVANASLSAPREPVEDAGMSEEELAQFMERLHSIMPTPTPPTYVEHPELPVFTSVPEGLVVLDATRSQTNDEGRLRVGAPLNACPMAGLVLIESSVNVSFGIAYDASASGGADPAAFCTAVPGANTVEFIPSPVAVGDRAMLTLSGARLYGGSY